MDWPTKGLSQGSSANVRGTVSRFTVLLFQLRSRSFPYAIGSSGNTILNYMVSLCTGSQVLNYGFMTIIYVRFYNACKVQGLDRSTFHTDRGTNHTRSILPAFSSGVSLVFLDMMCLCQVVGVSTPSCLTTL